MGNTTSQDDSEVVGYRVLGVQPNSPASKIGLVSFFDFIIAANGVPLKTLDSTFIDLIKASEDKPLPLTVYNCKASTTRGTLNILAQRLFQLTMQNDCRIGAYPEPEMAW